MHILLVHQAFAALNEPGGTRHHELARYLVQRGHRLTIITSQVSYLTGGQNPRPASQADSPGEGIEILRAYTYPALHRSFLHRVFSFLSFMVSSFILGLRVRQVDLVWGTSPPIFQGLTAWTLARLKGAPFTFEVRDLWPAFAIQVGVLTNRWLIRLSLWLERFLYRHADCVLVNSPGFIAHVQEHGARRVECVPNGSDPRMFDPQNDGREFREAHDFQGKFLALYAGAHGMSNDLGVALQAADLLRSRPDIALALLGDGKEKAALQRQAVEMQLENLFFLPPLAKLEMSQALAASNACLAILKPIPLYATVFPNKVFDYMAAGRPVLLAIDGVIREAVESAQAGIFVSPGDPQALADAIIWMADHPEQRLLMGLNGRRLVEECYNRSALAGELAVILEDLANSIR